MSERFVADGWRVRATWVLSIAVPAMGIAYLIWPARAGGVRGALAVLSGLAFLGAAIVLIWGLAHRRRPVVELSDRKIEFGSIYRFARRRRICVREVAAVELMGWRLDLALRSGEVVAIRVPELSRERRLEVRDAIRRRLQRPALGDAFDSAGSA